MKRYFLFFILIFLQTSGFKAFSQIFNWKAELAPVNADGFYRIPLKPEINSKLKNDFSDIRIYDKNGKEVPYLLCTDAPTVQTTSFANYVILEKLNKPKCCTEILLHNPEKKPINNISLIIKNADVIKQSKLLGSDDRENWFVVKDNHDFHSISNSTTTSEIKILDFPLVNYKYLKLWINDSLNAPINVLKAGYYVHFTEKSEYTEITKPVILQADSIKEKRSYITISFPEPQYIDKLELQLKGTYFYYRKAIVEVKDTMENGKTYYRHLQSFELSSHRPNTLSFTNEKAKELRIIIENEDNPPLQITSAQAWQLQHFLTAFLEKENNYSLQFGNAKINVPSYDLHYFKDSISSNIPIAEVQEIAKQTEPKITAKIETSNFTKKLAIWSGIGGVILLLGFITIKMVSEMSSEK